MPHGVTKPREVNLSRFGWYVSLLKRNIFSFILYDKTYLIYLWQTPARRVSHDVTGDKLTMVEIMACTNDISWGNNDLLLRHHTVSLSNELTLYYPQYNEGVIATKASESVFFFTSSELIVQYVFSLMRSRTRTMYLNPNKNRYEITYLFPWNRWSLGRDMLFHPTL